MDVTTINIPIDNLQQLFYACDVNSDGMIDIFELDLLVQKAYPVIQANSSLSVFDWQALMVAMFQYLDTNADGFVAINEMLALATAT